jgi:hypothetical protein
MSLAGNEVSVRNKGGDVTWQAAIENDENENGSIMTNVKKCYENMV